MAKLVEKHGGYKKLRSYIVSLQIYDGTSYFCDRFISKRSRTHDQMVQAARSGVQNIAEGSLASATSKKIEIKLTNVAKASLGELLLDYESYLRQHGFEQWDKDHPKALKVRNARPDTVNWKLFDNRSDAELANIMICLINQASFLLWKQIQFLEKKFLREGGFTEKMYASRKQARGY